MNEAALKQSHAELLNALECLVKVAHKVPYSPGLNLGYYVEMAEDAIDRAKKL